MLTDEVRAWIGRELVLEAPASTGRAAIRYYALAIGDDNPLYTDDEYARAHGYPSVIAPPTMICETNQFVPGARDAEGLLTQIFELPVEGARQIRGGNTYRFERPLLPADRVTIRWRLDDIAERTSKDGAPMLVVTAIATYTNQDGELLATNEETVIYQGTRA
ncbi:MAG: MaoC family dehydratase N-terminal domain-containing protein [Actinomycetota bacterium]